MGQNTLQTLYQITCGIMHNIRKFCPEINFFKDAKFYSFRTILDSEMKRLKASGLGIVKRVEPISFNEEKNYGQIMYWEAFLRKFY